MYPGILSFPKHYSKRYFPPPPRGPISRNGTAVVGYFADFEQDLTQLLTFCSENECKKNTSAQIDTSYTPQSPSSSHLSMS